MRERTDEMLELGERIAEASALLDTLTHSLLTNLRAFDAAGGWKAQGALSCADWLAWRTGLDRGAAREKVRVARALGALPIIDEALNRAELSYSKVRAMTRVACAENEQALVELARTSTAAQLEQACRLMRAPVEANDDRRWLRVKECDDGTLLLQVKVSADEAELILRACEVSAEGGQRVDGL